MSANSILLDFSLDPARIIDEVSRKDIVRVCKEGLEKYLAGLKISYDMLTTDGYLCILSETGTGTIVTIRFFEQGLITINVEYYRKDGDEAKISFEQIRELENNLVQKLKFNHGQSLPPLQRGPLTRYFPTADERVIEYDIDRVLFDKRSEFQKIQIVHSRSLGNMLVLDELQNIAEADLIYTETLMCRGKEDYAGKEICILGGGDGALLYELLKEGPKMVVMLEIDEIVMQACNKYMNTICGDVLEKRTDDNYEIIVGDCMVYLRKYIKEGRKFDYVFGDLTDIPISDTPTGEIWDFIRTILESSFQVLKPDGKFMTHGNGVSCPESLRMYEDQLAKLTPKVTYTKSSAFVPSFMEEWVFYQVQREVANATESV
ncbi:spermine synthase isoform X2 [Anopheles merus]|uniref:AGAP005325-PA n=3 Tax=gambiae species complex TaxID=44542 RepID=Q7Q7G3_ANOGA|nr:spermine synthase isoform X2 [Anopheles coluzzii]XP_041770087.1 spermine synthase isoform X2 [Anopheles merus]XP_315341.4 spermine synthase isoform X2 [Anopheles gambiae]EAA11793.4 AGAP005325-PA [Anopheles gambiae str. PEST]